jgi:hypothetical protein
MMSHAYAQKSREGKTTKNFGRRTTSSPSSFRAGEASSRVLSATRNQGA